VLLRYIDQLDCTLLEEGLASPKETVANKAASLSSSLSISDLG